MKRTPWNDDWTVRREEAQEAVAVTLPHDAMIHESRITDGSGDGGHAFFPGGKYVYEKTFTCPEEWKGGHVILEFEGVYRNAEVFVNGEKAGGCAYGYIPFQVPIDSFLKENEDNTVTVTADNTEIPNSRWYSGSGIYRPVNVLTGGELCIAPQGVRISTKSILPAEIEVATSVWGGEGRVFVEIFDGEEVVASAFGDKVTLEIPDAKLWSAETPYLYAARVSLMKDDEVVDVVCESFGIRELSWDTSGFYVNGRETYLRGGCVHHDSGILGSATYAEAEERRVRILKEGGFNAIRSSHNPISRAAKEACDKLGMYIMDETWDMWFMHKTKFDYGSQFEANWEKDVRSFVDYDFNHPSVVMYSIGNEVSEPATEKGIEQGKAIVNLLHELDSSRPTTGGINLMIITMAKKGKGIYDGEGGRKGDDKKDEKKKSGSMNSTMFNLIASMVGTNMNKAANGKKADEATSPVLDALDIAGYNYASGRYPIEGKAHPDRIVVGSETFPQDIYKNWKMVEKYPYLIGDFMWTSWDYIGECGIGSWGYTKDSAGFDKPYPWLLADVGVYDVLGNENAELYLAQAAWGLLDAPKIAVQPVNHPGVRPAKSVWRGTNALPSWSWALCDGNKAVIEVYAGDEVDCISLGINGRKVARRKVKNGKAVFKAAYETGRVTAIAFDKAGIELSRTTLYSAGADLRVVARPEKASARPGEVIFVPVTVEDEKGIVEMNADRTLTVTVEGGELLAFGSANPRTEERYDTGSYSTYYGRALAVVRAGDQDVTVRVKDGDDESVAVIAVK